MTRKGFTLVEMIFAVTMAIFVMLAVVNTSTMMVRQHLQSIHRGEVSAMTMQSIDILNRDLENATYIYEPTLNATDAPVNSTQVDVVAGCVNYSKIGSYSNPNSPGPLDPNTATYYFYYCVSAGRFGTLYRYSNGNPSASPVSSCALNNANCCTAAAGAFPVPASCGAATDNATPAANAQVIASGDTTTHGISHADLNGTLLPYYFQRTRDTNGVEMHFIVGNSTPSIDGTAGRPGLYIPHFYRVDTKVNLSKSMPVLQSGSLKGD